MSAVLFTAMLIASAKVKQSHPIANMSAANLANILSPVEQILLHILHLLYLPSQHYHTSLTEAVTRAAIPNAVSTATMSGKRLLTKG